MGGERMLDIESGPAVTTAQLSKQRNFADTKLTYLQGVTDRQNLRFSRYTTSTRVPFLGVRTLCTQENLNTYQEQAPTDPSPGLMIVQI